MFRNKSINIILIITTLLFSVKWVLSFYFFKESLAVKIIFESVADGHYWYPYIKYLAFFELDNSFDPYVKNLKLIPIPFASIIFPAIFLKIFGFFGIIIIEFFAIFIFLFIFYKIFSYFFSKNESIFLSLFFFMIPAIIKIANLDGLTYLNLFQLEFYSLRIPRPLIPSLYFFSFIYLLVFMDKTVIFEKKRMAALGLIFGFSLSSYYFFFINEFLAFLFFLIYKFKLKIVKELFHNYKYFLISIFVFLIAISPFIINLIYHESDVTERLGTFALTIEKKSKLIDYYLSQYFKLKFLLVLLLSVLFVYFSNKKKVNNVKLINIFFIIFLSTIVSPVFFVLISPLSGGLLSNFNNAIFVWGFIFFTIFSIILIKHYLKLNPKPLQINILIFLLIGIYYLNVYLEKNQRFNNQDYKDRRIEFQKVTEKLNNRKDIFTKNISLLTFDGELMIWAILNEIKYLNLISGLFSPKTHDMIENDLVKNFKFLNLKEKDFLDFFKNKKRGWRFHNLNVGGIFGYRYKANSLNTYKGSTNFEPSIKEFILSSSPMYHQQLAIPNEEFGRLQRKFNEYKFINFKEPEIIVLEKLKPITKNIVINRQNYSKLHDGNIYILYLKKNPIKNE
jgi:hypothetical protein